MKESEKKISEAESAILTLEHIQDKEKTKNHMESENCKLSWKSIIRKQSELQLQYHKKYFQYKEGNEHGECITYFKGEKTESNFH